MPDLHGSYDYRSKYWNDYAAGIARQLRDAYGTSRRARSPGGTTGRVGNPAAPHISQIGAQTLASQVGLADQQARAYLKELITSAASNAQFGLQALVKTTYPKGTGRLARGIRVTSKIQTTNTGMTGVIHLAMPRYRESGLVTNVGNAGHFKMHPVQPYQIIAKGAVKLLGRRREGGLIVDPQHTKLIGKGKRARRWVTDPDTGRKMASYRQLEKRTVNYAQQYKGVDHVPRLKIPRGGYSTGIRRGGLFTLLKDLSEARVGALAKGRRFTETTVANQRGWIPSNDNNTNFRYPIWVIHPGFGEDVISNYWDGTIARVMESMPQLAVTYVEAVNKGGKDIKFTSGGVETGGVISRTKPIDPNEFHNYIRSLANPAKYTPASRGGTVGVTDWNRRYSRQYGYIMKP